MNVYKAFAEEIDIERQGVGNYLIIDAAQSVGKKYPVAIGHVTVIKGFMHYIGDKYSTHKGVKAVFVGNMAEGPNHSETIRRVLREGLLNGRDDRQ